MIKLEDTAVGPPMMWQPFLLYENALDVFNIYDADATTQNKELFLTKQKTEKHYETQPKWTERTHTKLLHAQSYQVKNGMGQKQTYYKAITDCTSLRNELDTHAKDDF